MTGCGHTGVRRLPPGGGRAAVHSRIGLRLRTLLIDAVQVATVHPVKDGFRFGRFELDVRARELRKDAVRLRLQDQPFEVLVMLLEQPGEVLTRDELRRRLWPDGTFVDFEHGLNAAVKRLRAALGDNADRPRFVETLNRRGYRFIGAVDRIEPQSPHAGGAGGKVRLAVLPFADLGGTTGHEYFSEGLTEEMITRLGRWCSDRLAVVARTSSMLVHRTAHTPREIGRSLQADFLLSGGIRRDGDRVRITARLIETRGETQLWAESYDRPLSDCFLVQSQVASEIAQSLAMELLPESRTRRAGTRQVAAHQAFLKGRYHWNKAGMTGVEEAVAFYEQAVALDPDFSAAHASLARAHVAAAEYYLREPRQALEAGRLAAARALELDPSDSDAHLALAEVRKTVDLAGAEAAYRSALAFNPSSEGAHRLYGLFLAARGRIPEAALAAQRACDLDPLCLVVNTSAAWVRYLAREYDEAIDWCRHTLDMDPQFGPAYRVLAAALVETGRIDEAISIFEQAMAAQPDAVLATWLAHALALRGDISRAIEILKPLDRVASGYVSPYHRALAYTALNRMDAAVALLGAAFEERDPAIVNLAAEPRFERLRADARYGALAKRLGLPNGQH
jgi:TolB-like protein/Tfp pilus assembly protein PilF